MRKQVYEVSGQYYVPVLKDEEIVLRDETHEILSHLNTHLDAKNRRNRRPDPCRSEHQGLVAWVLCTQCWSTL